MSMNGLPDYRLGDAERSKAIDELGIHVAQGRLNLDEYEERVDRITHATKRAEVMEVFADLPRPQEPVLSPMEPMYSRSEIMEAHRSGRRIRLGVLLLGTLVSFMSLGATGLESFLFLPFILYILLYLFKVGPSSWHAPSAAALDRRRQLQAKSAQREELMWAQYNLEQQRLAQRAIRQQKQEELKTNVLDATSRLIAEARRRHS
ncbi:DUF1707 domain-containing protein [Corynebacterium sp. ES2794-CONJ1]|uniref:DUF1707 SHOCT-like domain-containing protein n=1 Tax=unclassified Corynebacterium TaxID=2624378 RepID=UPI00216A0F49|nr:MULTISPECIES: DUF1707 domain-containing protein [unclassified Corynebacterium]MCS4490168.1 DUF1707 domain-containing protein [Corynebacterium sp. ES2775-CONJ]MCS4492020.1 DUF1707 domain-containing protein [Corynebacterium sp. ES2715-CONJ3]MCU9519527.1 DUF1707 domain-containing protein [Corynebacterium sp. ES2794-CONJ1]